MRARNRTLAALAGLLLVALALLLALTSRASAAAPRPSAALASRPSASPTSSPATGRPPVGSSAGHRSNAADRDHAADRDRAGDHGDNRDRDHDHDDGGDARAEHDEADRATIGAAALDAAGGYPSVLDDLEASDPALFAASPELAFAGSDHIANVGDALDAELRHRRPSRWGRLDVALTWRRKLDDPDHLPTRRDELWLVAIWSR